jgi:hypothetical protein
MFNNEIMRSYFNPVRIIIKETDIFKLPKFLNSALFEYEYKENKNFIMYDGTKIIDPLVKYIRSTPYEKFQEPIKYRILGKKINDSEIILESQGFVPPHHVLRIHDILMKQYDVKLANKYEQASPYDPDQGSPFKFDFIGKTKFFEDSYNIDDRLNKIENLLKSNIKELLVPLFYDYASINKLKLVILDPKWCSMDGTALYDVRCEERSRLTREFILASNKYKALMRGVGAQFLAQGGLQIYGVTCPINELLIDYSDRQLRDYPYKYKGELVGQNTLIRGGFIPFWQMVYLKESLNDFGIKSKLLHDEHRGITVENFGDNIESITEQINEKEKDILYQSDKLSCFAIFNGKFFDLRPKI